ncbi:ABC transporter permease [Cohnella thailandensis]|uniref:ABC transporter permease n=1 Tax=Cohnella thailandensis TaxID=557557 RepID=A0A841SZS2_9BACL|nr:ABC transporter permease [Cohnella thailandensis]MBB6635648.1 ABC transporter permease [Cohnella thailandensis]MBP1976024.1 ribose/xylose/arabinose/galactoside ABC-type transport system permease subunit [Cohnella thailandensis]
MKKAKTTQVSLARLLDLAPLLLLIVFLVVFGLMDSRIVSGANLLQTLVTAAPIAIMGIGAMIVLISGGIDLSAGYGVSLCAVVAGVVLRDSGSLIVSVLATLLVGALVGVFNGFFVGKLKLQSFIVTLGSMSVIQGVTLTLVTGGVILVTDPTLKTIGIKSTFGIPNILMIAVVLVVLASFLIKRTTFGLRTYGIGSSEESTRMSGVPIVRQQYLIYIFSGVCTALAALMLISRVSIVSPNIGGTTLLMDAITATVIGGTSIFGGKGSIAGTLVGALIISLISQAMSTFGVSASSLDFFKGLIIVLALILDMVIRESKVVLNKRRLTA